MWWQVPAWVESAYAGRLGPILAIGLSRSTGRLPVGLAEWAVLGAPIGALWLVLRAARAWRGGESWHVRLLQATQVLLGPPALLVALFYLLWGLNYARPPLAVRLGWQAAGGAASTVAEAVAPSAGGDEVAGAADPAAEPVSPSGQAAAAPSTAAGADVALLAFVAEQLVLETNRAYRSAMGEDDLGRPSSWADARDRMAEMGGLGSEDGEGASVPLRSGIGPPRGDGAATPRRSMDAAIDVGLAGAGQALALDEGFLAQRGPAKPVRNSWLLSRLQLAGFYFPWTGEANYNAAMPAVQLPHTIAHEKAHQRGIASEDEANFIGFAGTVLSRSDYVRYSGLLFGQRQLLGELLRRDPAAAEMLLAERLPGVQRDVDAANAFWRRYDGRAAEWQRDVNDRYLRVNRVEGGIDSYRQSARLILRWAQASGGRLPLDGARPSR
jgi:hypothetical protein